MVAKHQLAVEILNALDEYTGACSVVVASANPRFRHGSGVAVNYGGKQYILTAAHVLREEPDNRNIRIIGKADAPVQLLGAKTDFEEAIVKGTHKPVLSAATPITITGRLSHNVEDIAALQVENLNAQLPHTLLHNLSSQGDVKTTVGETITILGFPGKLAQRYESRMTGQRGWVAFPHVTMQSVKDLATAPKEKDPNINFITDFDYSKEEEIDPHGMSGCGAWNIPGAKNGEIWSADRTQLLGIQIAYDRQNKVLVFVQIDRVLDLLSGKDEK